MTVWHLVAKEIAHRKLSFVLGLVSVVMAVGVLAGALTLLEVHDLRTRQILEEKEAKVATEMAALTDGVRKAMLRLGFNIVILPKGQNLADWYSDDYASKYMPEEYVTRLANSKIVTIRHLLPSLQQKVKWPEKKRTIILVGTRGEVPNVYKNAKKPLVEPVAPGNIVLGYELHLSLALAVGDSVTLFGREFTVSKCHGERGSKDDITAWINLAEAQELLDKKGLINAILALECVCVEADVAGVRDEISKVLPDTQVIERGSEALARAEARARVADKARAAIEQEKRTRAHLRNQRERFASILVPLVMTACALWMGLVALGNVRERRAEIGILRAMGLRSRQILTIFLSRAVLVGIVGGALGLSAGFLAGGRLAAALEHLPPGTQALDVPLEPGLVVLAMVLAPVLALVASWLPAVIAAQQDPAEVLRRE